MSRKSEKLGDISSASSLILCGRGTSTPIDTSQPPETSNDFIFRNSDVRAKKSLNFLHPAIEYENKLIFGRRNLQLLSDRAYEAANVASGPEFSLEVGENEKYVPKCPKTHTKRSVDTRTELKIKESIPVSKHTNGLEKEKTKPFKSSLLSSNRIRKKTDNKKKMYKGSALSEYFKDPKNKEKSNVGLEKLVVFKAGPIRKYAPVQPVKPRQITVPESPKISQRHRPHSCTR